MHLVIVGGDSYGLSPEYAASLPPLAERLGLAGAVTMTGQVPDAGPYMQRMDILVNASDPEPFGIVLLEGMAQRAWRSSRSTRAGPASSSRTGARACSRARASRRALADALEPLLASRQRCARSSAEAGRERFLREFTDAAMQRPLLRHARSDRLAAGPATGQRAARGEAAAEPCSPRAPAHAPRRRGRMPRRREESAAEADLPDVTIVAHDIGAVGGMERQLAELVARDFARLGHRVTVIARTCELPPTPGSCFIACAGPGGRSCSPIRGSCSPARSPCADGAAASCRRPARSCSNRVDVIAVHYCHQVGAGHAEPRQRRCSA